MCAYGPIQQKIGLVSTCKTCDSLKFFDPLGRLLTFFTAANEKLEVPLNLPAGLYLLRLHTAKGASTEKKTNPTKLK